MELPEVTFLLTLLLCLWSDSHCCEEGDVRLVDGFSANGGRVEFCHDREWGTVCDGDWGYEEAEVVCRQLGLPTAAVSFLSSFGGGNGSIFIDNAACSGDELRLAECTHNGIGNHDCNGDHTEDAGVFCDANESNCTLVVSSPGLPPTLPEPLTRTCLQRYGNCVPYRSQEQESICDDFYISDVDYVYVPNTRYRGRYSRLMADIVAYGELVLAGLDHCNDIVRRVICHFYLSPCGNSTHFESPTSVCKETCHQIGKMCGQEWESIVVLFELNRLALASDGMTFINCEDPGRHLKPLPYQCSNLNINPILDDDESHHHSHGGVLDILLCIVLPAVLASIATVVIVTVTLVRRHKKRQARTLMTKPSVHIERPKIKHMSERKLRTPNSQRYAFDNSLQPITPAANLPRVPSAYIRNLTNQHLLIPRQNIYLIAVVGQGEFGVVYKAKLEAWQEGSMRVETVAVKTLKVYSEYEQNRLIEESLVMTKFDHMNVIKLIGVSPHNRDSLYIVMPFMIHGSLLSYLRKNRADLTILTEDDLELVDDVRKKLCSMCLQIAKGMSYLASLQFLHRDLAARNCMLDENFVIKVADFGLSEDIYSRNYFRQGTTQDEDGEAPVKLPVRWMALESLSDGIFSEMTDVWSFGVTCWEVFSLGKMPYPGIEPHSLVKLLERGERLEKPPNAACSQEIYTVLEGCWNEEPDRRPTFSDLETIISNSLEGVAGYLDLASISLSTAEHPLNNDMEIISP